MHLLCLQPSANHEQREEERNMLGPVAVHIGNKAHFVFVICISLFFVALTAHVFTDEKKPIFGILTRVAAI